MYLRMMLGAVAISIGLVAAAILRVAQLLLPRRSTASRAVVDRLPDVQPVGAASR